MPTGDGLLVRLRLSCGVLPVALALRIAAWAERCGNGHIEISSRAALQIRGVSERTLPVLTAAMAEAGLLDASPEAEAVRNVIASPLSGIDPTMDVDPRPVAQALERMLAETPELHRLPAKFSWIVDGGGALPLDGVDADVRFRADGDGFAVGLQQADGIAWIDRVAGDQVPARAAESARWFLSTGARRMRAVTSLHAGRIETPRNRREDIRHEPLAGPVVAGGHTIATLAGLPFGRMTAQALIRLAEAAPSSPPLRLTPFRAIAVPGEAAGLADAGFITDPADPRLAISACPGAPACSSARSETLSDAERIARAAQAKRMPTIHISGCAKGCAHPHAAEITLVGEKGGYGVVHNGTARDAPSAWLGSDRIIEALP
jgi:precorrin-3B synthase